jgi:hypothetical protein
MFNEDSTWENLEELQLQFPGFDVNSRGQELLMQGGIAKTTSSTYSPLCKLNYSIPDFNYHF